VNEGGVLSGLCLTKEESKEFDQRLVVPYLATGDKEPSNIIFYQLVLADCPHLNEKNECKIYDKRPLICRVFPLHPELGRVVLLPKCPQIGKYWTKAGEPCPVIIDNKEIEDASSKITHLFLIHRKECIDKNSKFWYFDLATKNWISPRID
jgi:Fe-S-cluster containining protein